MNWFYDLLENLYPFTAFTSSPFCNLSVGDYFEECNGTYRLLERDAVKVRVVRKNWFTNIFWGKNWKPKPKL